MSAITASGLAIALLVVFYLLATSVRPNARIQTTALAGILLCSLVIAAVGSRLGTGSLYVLLQFALDGWPDGAESLPRDVTFLGIALRVLAEFGFPILLVTVVYQRITRRTTMQIGAYIRQRDDYIKAAIFEQLTIALKKEQSIQDPWQIAEEVMKVVHLDWDQMLPQETQNSMELDEVYVIGEERNPAWLRR